MTAREDWVLSPVVGEVTNLTAVVICEPIVKTEELEYSIKGCSGEGIVDPYDFKATIEVEEVGPTRVLMDFPEEGHYKIAWYSRGEQIFTHTIAVTSEVNKMIFVSCDLLEADTHSEDSMWTRMRSELVPRTNSIKRTCIFHVGDQAYMDSVFKDSVHYAHKHGHNDNTAQHIIKEFGKRYSDTWMPHNNILASVSNYNLWDDHEIKNNMMLSDTDLSDDEIYVRDLAVDAYSLYQEFQHLHRDEIISRYSWAKRMGAYNEILVLAIERTSRLISVKEILDTIDTLTTNVRTDRLIICFASAPIPPPNGRYGSIYRRLVGDKGTVETSKFWPCDELAALYRGLFSWMEKENILSIMQREVLVVGGDLHFGTYGIAHRNGMYIPVVIASPITNHPTADRWLASKGMPGLHYITDGSHEEDNSEPITFTTVSSKARRCYASVDLDSVPMRIDMHYSTHKLPRSTLKYLKTLISFK